jgi:hypothetical protein
MTGPQTSRALVLATLSVCCACSGGGGGAASTTPTPPDVTPAPPEPVTVLSVCPANDAGSVGTNSVTASDYGVAINSNTLKDAHLRLNCGRGNITGTLVADASVLRFIPSEALPSDARCEAALDTTGIVDLVGQPLAPVSWSFQTGAVEREQWYFSEPVRGLDHSTQWLKALYVGEHPMVLGRALDTIYVGMAEDAGAYFRPTISLVTPDFGGVQEFDAAYLAGRLRIAWRFLPYNIWESDIYYAQSNADVTTFSEPEYISKPYDTLQALWPSLAMDKSGHVRIAWQEICSSGYSTCEFEDRGVSLATVEAATGEVLTSNRITHANEETPTLGAFDDPAVPGDGLFMAFSESFDTISSPNTVKVVLPGDGNSVVGTPAEGVRQVWPQSFKLARIDGTHGALHWEEGSGTGGHSFFLADIDAVTPSVGPARRILDVPLDQYRYYCSRVETDGAGTLAWLSSLSLREDNANGERIPTTIEVRLSRDGGHTFADPIPLDFLLEPLAFGRDGQSDDSACPAIAISTSGKLFVAWNRNNYPTPMNNVVLTTVGIPGRPCAGAGL